MGFLHPAYLLAALAAVVPLVIHLLHRQRVVIVEFPSLEFLRSLLRKRSRRFQLRQLLALILRMLLIVFLALALAHPTLKGKGSVAGHVPTAVAIILDDTFSMMRNKDGIELFEIAKQKAQQLLSYFGSSDELHVFLVSGNGTEIASQPSSPASILSTIDAQVCKKESGTIWNAIQKAAEVLSESDLFNKEIYIISDMQESTWVGVENHLGSDFRAKIKSARVMIIDLGEDTPNTCIRQVILKMPVSGATISADVTIEHFGGDQGAQVVEVYVRGGLQDRSVFSLSSGSQTKHFQIPALDGFVWGEVRTLEDQFPYDDRRYFAFNSGKIVVGVVGDSKYIATALDPKGGSRFRVVELPPNEITPAKLTEVDGLVLSNISRLSLPQVEALSEFVHANGGLVIFLGSQIDVGFYNRYLLPQFGNMSIEGLVSAGSTGFFSIQQVSWDHPIFSKFSRGESPFVESNFSKFFRLDPGDGKVLAWFSDGSPAIVEPRQGVMVFATSADGDWNDLVLSGQFVPILHETQAYVSSRAGTSSSFLIGEDIVFRTKPSTGEVIIDGVTGQTRMVPDMLQGGMSHLKLSEEPGIYFIRAGSETLSVVALNVDTRESDLTKVSPNLVKAVLEEANLRVVREDDDIPQNISALREGRDLMKHMLWIALGLLIAESVIASTLLSPTSGPEISYQAQV